MSSDPKPAVSYWHLWTDAEGVSHQTRCTMTEFEKAAIAAASLSAMDRR